MNTAGASERWKVEKHGIDSAHSYREIMYRPCKKVLGVKGNARAAVATSSTVAGWVCVCGHAHTRGAGMGWRLQQSPPKP